MTSSATHRGVNRVWLAALEQIRRRRSVILGYHGVSEERLRDDLSLLQVAPARFRSLLELMLAAGFRFVTVAELARISASATPPPGLAVVTFDDGMRNNHSTALPILRELEIPATIYVASDFIGGRSPWIGPGGDGAMLDEAEIRELAAAGWEIGAHTITHSDLSQSDYEVCLREIRGGREVLERITGAQVQTFAYPFGRYGPAALAAVRAERLLAAVTTGSGSWAPFELTRAMIGAADPFVVVLLKMTDRYEPLLALPPLRAARWASRRLRQRGRDLRGAPS
jgi:peptidoglycan/xylan/chitin deacetylase (PgdA/CDA1 family)